MYIGQDFDPIEPGETDTFSFEFSNELASGVTLSNPVFTCVVLQTLPGSTLDASPSSRINGAASVTTSGTQSFANQSITGMIAGNKYILEATVTTSDGRTLKRYAHVLCLSPY